MGKGGRSAASSSRSVAKKSRLPPKRQPKQLTKSQRIDNNLNQWNNANNKLGKGVYEAERTVDSANRLNQLAGQVSNQRELEKLNDKMDEVLEFRVGVRVLAWGT